MMSTSNAPFQIFVYPKGPIEIWTNSIEVKNWWRFSKDATLMLCDFEIPCGKLMFSQNFSMQSNPGWGFDKKCQFMDKLVREVNQCYN